MHSCEPVRIKYVLYFFKDDEINVMELDFALKAVNYNLISDAELTYVNKV